VRSGRPFYSPEVYVCEASAGSGKTYALAERYVRLILHLSSLSPRPPLYAILAITFTNKAAFEMKERIIRFLKQLALGVMNADEEAALIDGLGMDPVRVRAMAGSVIAAILRGYNYFQVQTIDRFINALLVSSAFQIGLTSAFRIKTDPGEYLSLAIDELIEEARHDAGVRKLFDDMLTSLLLVEARSAWMPKDVVADTIQGLFREYNTYARPFVRGQVSPDDLLRLKVQVVDDVRAFVANMPPDIHKTVERSLRNFVDGDRRAFVFSGKLSAYFSKDAEDIDRFELEGWHADQWQKIRRGFIRAAEAEVVHLYDPYIELFGRVREKWEAACRKDDVLFLAELNAKARRIYEHGIAPEELYYRLSTRFEHFLFDEFQDTSLLQWENLKALPEDAIARGGSLFYVGDKKQAIFSFRGGDTVLFDAIRRQYSDPGYHCVTRTLSESRRSRQSIVLFNNAVFDMANLTRVIQPLSPSAEDLAELERIYGHAAQTPLKLDPPGCVRVVLLEGKTQEEAREQAVLRVTALVQELRGRFEWGDIGVLVRKNSEVAWMTRALLEAGIPAASERTLNIREHPHVLEVAALLRALNDPQDNEAAAAVLLGDLFLKASGVLQAEIQDFILAWRQRRNEPFLLNEFQRVYPRLWQDLIAEFAASAGLYPGYELLASIIYRWGMLAGFPESRGFLMHFLELARAKENDYPSLESFLEYFDTGDGEEFFVPSAGTAAVRVATVHKSKGLEYRVVILPFFTLGLERGGGPGSLAPKYVLKNGDDGLALYHFNETHAKFSVVAAQESARVTMQAFFNELNNAYVALTRAVCEMHVFIPPKSGNAANLALTLVPEPMLAVGVPAAVYPEEQSRDAQTVVEVAPPECRDWLGFLQDEFLVPEAAAHQADRRAGIILHAVLAQAKALEPGEVDVFLDRFLPDLSDEGGLLRRMLRGFLTDPGIVFIFRPCGAVVHTEYELVDRYGRSHRVDRLIIDDTSVTVVDFKTTRAELIESELAQVRGYMGLLRSIYPGKEVRGMLAFIRERELLDVQDIHG
jgi:ATP-dependent exoDNAse (exonuclease V) beta subunit